MGKILIVAGVVLIVFGAVLLLSPKIPWLGRLPGDIRIEGERSRFYFPIVSCLVLSLILTGLLNLIGRWWR